MADDDEPLSCVDVIHTLGRLSTPRAVDVTRQVVLSGVPQVVNIRGKDNRNPVLLFVHGGPGTPLAPTTWMWQRPVEEFFTVVHYDQRGAGRSFRLTDRDQVRSAMGVEQFVDDAVELVEWLQGELAVDQVIIAGHSWGTVIATKAVLARPELFMAYLGVGQVVDFRAAEAASFGWVSAQAHRHGNEAAVAELEALAPYPGDGHLDVAKIITERRWVREYGGFAAGRSDCDYFTYGEVTSLDYRGEELASAEAGNLLSTEVVVPQLTEVDLTTVTEFPVPMVQFLGRHDQMTPADLVPPWMEAMTAPYKAVEWFEDSAHMAMYEEPGHFLTALLHHLRPASGHDLQQLRVRM